jgi:site-specific recombinase XerD
MTASDNDRVIDDSAPDGPLSAPAAVISAPAGALDAPSSKLVDARTDSELALSYLNAGEYSAASRRNLEKEVGRFLLWCHHTLRKSLAELTVDDIVSYREMLRDPPAALVSPRRVPRIVNGARNPDYRPFNGPLSDASRRQALLAVRGLMGYAERSGYLSRNPAALVKNVKAARGARLIRYLTPDTIEQVLATLRTRAASARTPAQRRAAARDLFMVATFWATGARLDELASARMGNVYREDDGRWWLDVLGKGARYRRLPLGEPILALLRQYRAAFSLPEPVRRDDALPLLLATRGNAHVGVTAQAASIAVKAAFTAAAQALAARGDIDGAARLGQASTHWIRHSMISWHANERGVPIQVLQATAGHSDIKTTAGYLHVADNDRHDLLTRDALMPAGKR